MKNYILILTLLFCGTIAIAQDSDESEDTSSEGYAPSGGDFSAAILYGRGLFIDTDIIVPSSITFGSTVNGSSPTAYAVIGDDNDATNMFGGELRYFFSDKFAVRLGGAAILRETPDRPNAPSPNPATIPNYAAVEAVNTVDVAANLTFELHFSSKYDRLYPYLGLNIPYYYARRSYYDPTISGGSSPTITDIGPRHFELMGFGGQIAAGVDYYLLEGFFFGFEIKPASYIYLYSTQMPAPGLEERQADTHTASFFTQPVLKMGFRF